MHRSGTSALTRVLNLLGVELGNRLIPADACNLSGYWENIDLMELNGHVLRDLGASWDSVWDLPKGWHERVSLDPHRQDFVNWVSGEVASSRLWGAKDPRLSRVLPLWVPVLQSLDIAGGCVHIFRHPAAVVASLRKRDVFSVEKAYILWLRYVLEAEWNSRSLPRAVVAYEQLTTDWEAICRRISTALDFSWPTEMSSASQQISMFLAHGQNRIPREDRYLVGHRALEELVGLTYSALCQHQVQDDLKIRHFFDLLRERLNQLTDRFQPTARESRRGSHDYGRTRQQWFHEQAALLLQDIPGIQEHATLQSLTVTRESVKWTAKNFKWMLSRRVSRFRSWIAPDDTRQGALVRFAILAWRTLRNEGIGPLLGFVGCRLWNRLRLNSQSSEVSSSRSQSSTVHSAGDPKVFNRAA